MGSAATGEEQHGQSGRHANLRYGTLLHTCLLSYQPAGKYNVPVRSLFSRRIVQIPVAVLACAALVSLILLVIPKPHRPLDYMIAGTAGTVIWLGMVLAILVRSPGTAIRIVRRRTSQD